MSSARESSKAANRSTPQDKPWLPRKLGWLGRRKEQERKDAPEEFPPPPKPVSLNRRNNNREDFHLSSTRNASGMFYRLLNTGMDPYEARELLLKIIQDDDEPKPRTSTEERAEKTRKRRVRFLDEVYLDEIFGVDQPPDVETMGDPPPRLGLGDGFGGERFREMFGEFVEDGDKDRVLEPSSRSENCSNTSAMYGHLSLEPVTSKDPDTASPGKVNSSCSGSGDDEKEDNVLDDVGFGEIGRITPRSAYSKESRLLCERYVPTAAAAE